MDGAASPVDLISVHYVSSAVKPFSDLQMLDLLRVSRRNNCRRGITGMLLYKGGNMMQVLEGPEAAVAETMRMIQLDSRHQNIHRLYTKHILERQFGRWLMAFRDISHLASSEDAFSPFMHSTFQDDDFRQRPELAYKLLLEFRQDLR